MLTEDYARVEQAIHYIAKHFRNQPTLAQVADSVGLSEYHFQRLFQRWAGISPKRFVQYLMASHAERLLQGKDSLLDVTYASGLSSPSRLHGLFVSLHAMTPAEWRGGGSGLDIRYGMHPSPFGNCLLAQTSKGICAMSFVSGDDDESALRELRTRWPMAQLHEDKAATRATLNRVFGDSRDAAPSAKKPIALCVRGTNFQVKVWEALLRIPAGQVSTYGDVASAIGAPRAARAVGSAVGSNPVAYLIPCHRVIRGSGVIGDYHWGPQRKHALLALEWARATEPRNSGAELRYTTAG